MLLVKIPETVRQELVSLEQQILKGGYIFYKENDKSRLSGSLKQRTK